MTFRFGEPLLAVQHDLTGDAWSSYQSVVHCQTLPAMSYNPYPFGANVPTGAVHS